VTFILTIPCTAYCICVDTSNSIGKQQLKWTQTVEFGHVRLHVVIARDATTQGLLVHLNTGVCYTIVNIY